MPPYVPNADLHRRYGVVRETITKWKNNPKLNFPKPAAIINGREFFDEPELDEWDQRGLNNPEAA
jgi:hypothetical protein